MSKRGTSKRPRYGTTTGSTTHVVSPKSGMAIQAKLGTTVDAYNPFTQKTSSLTLPSAFTKGRSSRNTSWNGVDNTSGKWKGHVASATDSITSAGLGDFDIMGRGFQEVIDLLNSVPESFTLMAEDAIAKGAAEGRKRATVLEQRKFNFGKVWTHAAAPSAAAPGGRWQSSSRFDPRLGGYRGVGSSGNALRLINFNFKAGHTYGSLGGIPGTVEARVTSQMANLFENDATWRRKSPFWTSNGSAWGVYRPGDTRPGKHYFSRFYVIFDRGLLDGIKAAEKSFEERIKKNEKKEARVFRRAQKLAKKVM